MRKRIFCLCENKGADQLHSSCEADQRLCIRYMNSAIPLPSKSKISEPASVTVPVDLCWTWSETIVAFFMTLLILFNCGMQYLPTQAKSRHKIQQSA